MYSCGLYSSVSFMWFMINPSVYMVYNNKKKNTQWSISFTWLIFRGEILIGVFFSHCHFSSSDFPFEDLPNGKSVPDNKTWNAYSGTCFFYFPSLLFAYYSQFRFNKVAEETLFKNLTLTNEQLQELYSRVTSGAAATPD